MGILTLFSSQTVVDLDANGDARELACLNLVQLQEDSSITLTVNMDQEGESRFTLRSSCGASTAIDVSC